MALISISNAYFDYGREKILRGVDLSINQGVKTALVGPNGAGKTTLLAAISGELDLQDGNRQVMGSAKIRLLRQETSLKSETEETDRLLETVASTAFAKELGLEQELATIAADLAAAPEDKVVDLIQKQGHLQAEYERLGGYTIQSRLKSALRGVGLLPETWDRPVFKLSGGERRRAALATVLLSGADLLLLDEPTNHLDLRSCEWLEGFLEQYPGAAIVVSHDRHFLDRVVTRTVHLERGRLTSYSGNYSFYDQQRELRYQQEFSAWERQQTRIKITEDYIRRNIEGQKTKQAQSRRKLLDKEERLDRPATEPGLFRFTLSPARPSGSTIFQTESLAKGYGGTQLVANFNHHVSRGDRIGIVGPNGCGKSTLLKMLAGRVIPDDGRVVIGHNVDLGFYDQELDSVSDHNTVLSEIAGVDPRATLGELRSFLGAFGFGEDLFDRQVGRLSGGERGRLALMRLIKEGHNTLLLDEPTNHLDIRSRESLEASLAEYSGTVLVVSHDRRFLNKIVQKLIVFPDVPESSDGELVVFEGNYADYIRRRDLEKQAAIAEQKQGSSAASKQQGVARNKTKSTINKNEQATTGGGQRKLSKNEIKRRQEKIDEEEVHILALETEKEELIASLGNPDLSNDQRRKLANRTSEVEALLLEKMNSWEQLNLEIEEGI